MNKGLKNYLGVWWKPMLTFIGVVVVYVLGLMAESKFIFDSLNVVIGFATLVVLVSAIYQCIIKKWYFGVLQAVLTFGVLFCLSLFLFVYPNDFFADNLEIPSDIAIEKPLDFSYQDDTTASLADVIATQNTNLTFELVTGSQPGIYEFYFWYRPTQLGSIYLKAYEITNNQELSVKRLKLHTETKITALTNTPEVFTNGFTIFEGDWGKPYGARFEVWFQPEKEGAEVKLTTKNYIIEGWMR